MRISIRKIKLAAAAVLALGWAGNALAVTEAEMNQAKAIAAKFYIRYADDASGYLDDFTPGSMAELEQKVTGDRDRELLRQFKAGKTPTDFAGWDKEKLTAYWSSTFFTENASGLDAKGATNGLAKKQIRNAIGSMTVSAPSAAVAPEPTPTDVADDKTVEEAILAEQAALENNIADVEEQIAEGEGIEDAGEETPEQVSGKSGTWVYIMILALLVVVVIVLVVYASKTMRGKPSESREPNDEEEEDRRPAREEKVREVIVVQQPQTVHHSQEPQPESRPTSVADNTRMREKFAETLASKAEEIRTLTRQLGEMEETVARLEDENIRLKREVERLRNRPQEHVRHEPRAGVGAANAIYLGRVNSQGVFVRADRNAVEGQSVYRLVTTDGHTGSFELISDPAMEQLELAEPGRWLAGGCFAKDIFDTAGRYAIVTEVPGVAIFSDGAWRVEKKAKIRYE